MYGGYVIKNGDCNVIIRIVVNRNMNIAFPKPSVAFDTYICINNLPVKIDFNGSIALKANDDMTWWCVYPTEVT